MSIQVLTPSGYQSPASLADGAEVCAFDSETGEAIVNHVENIDVVDIAEWRRWWQLEEAVPSFDWIKVNGSFLLFREQSIWRNGTNVCHARDLVVGDEIYDDADHPVAITSIETVTDETLVWYRFDISGDHSYIVDGLTVHNASRFWVGGTGTWDSSTTTHWASSSGGTGGQSVPGSSDAVTLDGSSGGGTVTPNFGGTITIISLNFSAFTGTLNFSANNNNVTLSGNANAFVGSGSSTKTINLGNGTWTLTGSLANNTLWNLTTTTNLTFNANNSEIVFSSPASGLSRTMATGSVSYHKVTFSGAGNWSFSGGSPTIDTLSVAGGVNLAFNSGSTYAISSLQITSTDAAISSLMSNLGGSSATISSASGTQSIQWCAIKDMVFSGGATFAANDSFDLGNNSGIAISAPSGGAAAVASPGLHSIEMGIAA